MHITLCKYSKCEPPCRHKVRLSHWTVRETSQTGKVVRLKKDSVVYSLNNLTQTVFKLALSFSFCLYSLKTNSLHR